jgi:hypothetical protein
MTTVTNEQQNLSTEILRRGEIDIFTRHFSAASTKIANLFGKDAVDITVNDSDFFANKLDAISGSFEVADVVGTIHWRLYEQILERNDIYLTYDLQNQGYGTKINEITENLARALGAKKFVLSAVVNPRWKKHLLKNGFLQDPQNANKVFKNL